MTDMHEDFARPQDDDLDPTADGMADTQPKQPKKNTLMGWCCCIGCLGGIAGIALFFAIISIGGAALSIADAKKGFDSQSWPSTQGKVVSSTVTSRKSQTTTTTGGRRRTRTTTYYNPAVTYEYVVDEKTYSSKRISYKAYGGPKEHAELVAGTYPAGTAVTVYYNPENPDESVLEPGVGWASFAGPLLWLSPFIIAILLVGFLVLRARKKKLAA